MTRRLLRPIIKSTTALFTLSLLTSPPVLASANNFWDAPDEDSSSYTIFGYPHGKWRGIIAGGGGVAIASNLGHSQSFPIHNPIEDAFYNYTAHSPTQGVGLYNIFAGAEWALNCNLAFQVGFDYYNPLSFQVKGHLTQGADVGSENTYDYKYNISTMQYLAEGKLLTTFAERYHPYIMGGAGISVNKACNYSTTVPPFLTFTRIYSNHKIKSFGWDIGAGVDYDFTPDFRIGLGYRLANTGKIKFGSTTIDGTIVEGTLKQSSLYINEIVGQLAFVF